MSISHPIFHLSVLSIAGMVRTEYDTSSSKDMSLRTSLLFRLAKQLKWLSDTFHICVVVVNQVENLDDFQSHFYAMKGGMFYILKSFFVCG